MFVTMLALLAQAVSTPTGPVLSGGTVSTTNAGACLIANGGVATPAQIQIAWSIAGVDAANYDIKIYENSVLLSTLAGSATSTSKTITGYVQDDAGAYTGRFVSNWVYRIDMVRKSDGVVVSTRSTANWIVQYGDCHV